jgi:hypothetical protein
MMIYLYRALGNTARKGARASIFKGVLMLFFTIFLASFPAWAFAGEEVPQGVRFSLNFQNERLGSVCAKITRATGYAIAIDPKWEGIPVSGSLKSVSVQEGLMRILNKFNTVISVDDGAKKCEVIIFERPGSIEDVPPIDIDKVTAEKRKVYSPDQVVAPPIKEGDRGITVKEIEAIIARHSSEVNGDSEVMPPSEPGKKGITKREIDAKLKQYSSSGAEVLPPGPPFSQKGIDGQGVRRSESGN